MADLTFTESKDLAKALRRVADTQFRLLDVTEHRQDTKLSEATVCEAAEEFVRAEADLNAQIEAGKTSLGI